MRRSIVLVCLLSLVAFGFAGSALAAEDPPGWRLTYDSVMRWINFFILAALIVKFAKTPLRDFISGQKEILVRELKRKEEEKGKAVREVNAILEDVKTSEIRLEEFRNRIIERGKKKRQELVDDANLQSRYMLASVQDRIGNQILKAKLRVKAEVIESAVGLALERLPELITEEDNRKFVGHFLSGTEKSLDRPIDRSIG